MELWYRKLGFFNNPFSIKPAAFHDELVSYDMDYIYSKIEDRQMIFLDGKYGTGKTTILKNIINRFKGKRKVAYYNFNKGEKPFDIKKLIDGSLSPLQKFLGSEPEDIILLLDEVNSITQKQGDTIMRLFKDAQIKSVIFVNQDYYEVSLPDKIEEMLDDNVIRTSTLSPDDAVKIIRKRIGDIEVLSDDYIRLIFKMSEEIPRKLLQNCEDICKTAAEFGDTEVTLEHIESILGKIPEEKPSKKKSPKKKIFKKNKLIEKSNGETIISNTEDKKNKLKEKDNLEIEKESTIDQENINPDIDIAKTAEIKEVEDAVPEYNVIYYDN